MDTPAAPASPRQLDPHFRWRGQEVSRLEGFSDAVFAIVLALLFLRAAPPESFGDLKAAMKALVPFAATFAIIAWIWFEHWLFSRRFAMQDGVTTFLNLLLLFLLLFYAYPLKFLSTLMFVSTVAPIGTLDPARMMVGFEGRPDAVLLFVFYGSGYGAIFGVLALLYLRALRRQEHLQLDRVERFLTRSAIVQATIQVGVATLSIVAALADVGVGYGVPGWLFGLIGPAMAVHGSRAGRRLEQLLAERVS